MNSEEVILFLYWSGDDMALYLKLDRMTQPNMSTRLLLPPLLAPSTLLELEPENGFLEFLILFYIF